MGKVLIYNTQEEMWKQLGRKVYKNNLKTKKVFVNMHERVLLEYKEESGFNKSFLEAQEKNPGGLHFSPAEVHLSRKEQEKFNDHYRDLGNGLEQTVLVALMACGKTYSFGEGNNGELFNSFEEGAEYDNIPSLAQGIKEELSKIKYFGMIFTPAFYTTREEMAITPEEISKDPEGFLRQLKEDTDRDDSVPTESKKLFLEGLQSLAYCKDKIRGLTEAECSEFEKLFYQQDSNTP